MAYASRFGRATANADNPQAYAVCDRCNFGYRLIDLQWQFDWNGPRLMNQRLLVCKPCLDIPFEHNRPIVTPPDPIPKRNPRPLQTNQGANGWSFGAWSAGSWSVGQTPTQAANIPPEDLAPPQDGGTFDE